MATASSEPRRRGAARGRGGCAYGALARRASRAWMFVAFFVGFFLFWQYSIDLFGIPRYILPKPSEIVSESWADIDRLLYYTYVTGSESVIGYVLAVGARRPARACASPSPRCSAARSIRSSSAWR